MKTDEQIIAECVKIVAKEGRADWTKEENERLEALAKIYGMYADHVHHWTVNHSGIALKCKVCSKQIVSIPGR